MRRILRVLLGVAVFVALWQIVVRLVRHFYKFPMPEFMAGVIDNPLRRKWMPPEQIALRHGIQPGMTVLEVGPGSGTYTLAAARRAGENGRLIAIDIEPRMIERVRRCARAVGIHNVEARVESVYALPFEDGTFDAAYMIFVIGEIPEPRRAMQEIGRVLKPFGTLAFTEVLIDPDYPLASTLIRQASAAGLRLKSRAGNFFLYTLVFEKQVLATCAGPANYRFAPSRKGR